DEASQTLGFSLQAPGFRHLHESRRKPRVQSLRVEAKGSHYLRGRTVSFSCFAMRAFTTVFAGILIASPVAGLRPIRALPFLTTRFTIPGSTNSPERFSSFSASAVSSSKNSRACVRFTSKRSAKNEKSSDLPILRASFIGDPPCVVTRVHLPGDR